MRTFIRLTIRELLGIVKDTRYIATVGATFILTLLMTSLLLSFVDSFEEGNLLASLPVSEKMIKIAVVGTHESVEFLSQSRAVYVVPVETPADAFELLHKNAVHGIYIVTNTTGKFYGGASPLAVLAEAAVREALSKWAKPQRSATFTFSEDFGLENLVKGLLAPILLLSPLFILSLPIIQSISYDRENKLYEVLFATPVPRTHIFLAKFGAAALFASSASLVWLLLVMAYGFSFLSPLGVAIVLVSVCLLILSINTFIATISKGIQEATLGSSIASTVVFTLLFAIVMFNLIPFTKQLATLSPATYISQQYTGESHRFPLTQIMIVWAITGTCVLLGMTAFSAERFAFSIKPGIVQLYEGAYELLRNRMVTAIAMGFIAFSLTSPFQLIVAALLFFILNATSIMALLVIMFGVVAVEEVLKGIGVYVLDLRFSRTFSRLPFSGFFGGIFLGALVGMSFGILESLLYIPLMREQIFIRSVPVAVHMACTGFVGGILGAVRDDARMTPIQREVFIALLFFATLFHWLYNTFLVLSSLRVV